MDESDSIAFVGDSITAGGDWQAWFPDREVHNLGVSGNTTDDLIARIPSVVAVQPASIALLVGTNDLGTRLSVEHLVRNVEFLLVTLRRELPGARLLLQSILPRGREFADQINDANRHLRQFSASVNAQYLDLWPAFAQDDGEIDPTFSDDRLHLTEAGYRAWLDELHPAIERLEDAPPMSRPIQAIRRF
ncbi:MAG: GDSL-type esterase/lipase family protein [Rhodoglobus sp.]